MNMKHSFPRYLGDNQISNLDKDIFAGLTNLGWL